MLIKILQKTRSGDGGNADTPTGAIAAHCCKRFPSKNRRISRRYTAPGRGSWKDTLYATGDLRCYPPQ